ncbi:MAG: hypothetical protein OXI81_14925 [Paracoccaceae bacterium]|nr:hypothetical protein [Paracoccaceae bacterium]
MSLAQGTVSNDQSACVPLKEPLEVCHEHLGLVDGDERPAVIDPDEFGVLEGILASWDGDNKMFVDFSRVP